MDSTDGTLEESASWYSSDRWKERIIVPTILAGIVGGGAGLVSKYRKVHGLSTISATYAANFAIVTGCYCGAREFVRASRTSKPNDLLNSAIGGFGSGALLGRLQVDYAALKLKPVLESFQESLFAGQGGPQKNDSWLRLPEWSPIQVLDEEALAAKRAREEKLYGKTSTRTQNQEKS